ncbi:DUF1330 domain-containing protein [Alphaproteobacteria bacterium]|nr:DUF1330 domain-containing protein [Alphaproteobacteria bacterium]
MKNAYWVVCYRAVNDAEKLAAYAVLAKPAVEAAGGELLLRGMPSIVLEAGENNRTVVIKFASLEQAQAAYESNGYREALAALGDGAVRDFRIVEAL